MEKIFTADFFIGNRKTLLQQSRASLVVLSANGLLQRSADTTFPFRQESNFWYFTGLEEPDYLLVISESQTFLIAPKRGEHRDMWDGKIDKQKIKIESGIDEIYEHHDGWTKLDLLLKKQKKVHTIAPAEAYLEHFGFYANPARAALLSALSKHRKLEIVDIRKSIARMRQIKQKPELAAIKRAISITASGINAVQKRLDKYHTETEITADLAAHFIRKGAAGHAYQPIIASGINAATIHYIANDDKIEPNSFLLMDVGAEVSNYSADITRTLAVGAVSKRHKEVYAAVNRVRQAAFELLKPGVDMKKYEQAVDELMAKELKQLKLLDDVKNKKQLKKYYPHLTSHFLGLDTHDAADYTQPLAPGMVLTVEPGIYIPEESIGIRIEDDILITETGAINLSADLSSDLS